MATYEPSLEAPPLGRPQEGPTGRLAPGVTGALIAAGLGQAWLVGVTALTWLALHGTSLGRQLADDLFPCTTALFMVSVLANSYAMVTGLEALEAARRDRTITRGLVRAALAMVVGVLGVAAMMAKLLYARMSL